MLTIPIAIDTGGTFTDLVATLPDGRTHRLKVPSTPDDPGIAVGDAIGALEAALGEKVCPILLHGTTVGTNALLQRRGAKVVLITNSGFEDLLALGRQARPDLYALHPVKTAPLIPRERTLGIHVRRGPGGEVLTPMEDIGAFLRRHQRMLDCADAYAITLLHSYEDGTDESQIAAQLKAKHPGKPITCSHQIAPSMREYERLTTATVNAYLAPIMGSYLSKLTARLSALTHVDGGPAVEIMGSSGGLLALDEAVRGPAHTVLSGPAGGVRGAWNIGARNNRDRLLTLDMGGTSTDVSVVLGDLLPEDYGVIDDLPIRVPLLPIETVGAGGGSIARLDDSGSLRVGPQSAGALPGPACYGRTTDLCQPTVTDANAVLGRIPSLLGGAFELDITRAHASLSPLANALDVTVEETARAVIEIAEANMARACKRVTTEQGVDPRTLSLIAFGGAGGLHACALADALGCRDVIFPAEPGVLSAEGISRASREVHEAQTLLLPETHWDQGRHDEVRTTLVNKLHRRLPGAGTLIFLYDVRYVGQSFTLAIPPGDSLSIHALKARFETAHEERYGYTLGSERTIELVAIRATKRAPAPSTQPPQPSEVSARVGPAVLQSYSATLWLPAHWEAERTVEGDWICTRNESMEVRSGDSKASLALEVHRQKLASIAEEMGAALMGSAFSANIKERRDYSCAIFDAQGTMLEHAAHIPVHLGSTPLSVKAAIDSGVMADGSTAILNDPYDGGTHLPDVTVVSPVFVEGHDGPGFYVANRAHHADVGGIAPGSLPSPFSADGSIRRLTIEDEGIRIPPSCLDDTMRKAFANASRTPGERFGDLKAQEAANRVGIVGLNTLAHSLGVQRFHALNQELLEYSERRIKTVIGALQDGEYMFIDHLDGDGISEDPIPIPVTIRIVGQKAVVDLSKAPDMFAGPLNAVRAIAVSAAFYVFRCIGGAEIPANGGLMRAIDVITRPGSCLDATYPAPVSSGNVETSQRLVDCILGALAKAAPGLIPAASCGSMNNVLFGGLDERQTPASPFVHYETIAGGAGGGPAGHGTHGIHTHMTNTLNTPIEALEHAFPVLIERYALGASPPPGDGEMVGGRGVIRTYRFMGAAEVNLLTERRRLAPYGLHGASQGLRGENVLIREDGTEETLPAKIALKVKPGECIQIQTPSGGAWQPPPIARHSEGSDPDRE